MSQTIATGGVPVELNGTFLRPPALKRFRRDPALGGIEGLLLQSQPGGDGAEAWPRLEVILEGRDLLPFHFLRMGDRMGRAVVKIQRDDGATGTGFLVAPDVLLTNHHVLPSAEVAAGAIAMANYEVSPANDPAGRSAVSPLDPGLLYIADAELDFTFCGIRGLDFLGAVPLDRERMHVAVGETVTIVQHPRGRPKEVALRDNRVVQADGVVIQYSCDTEPGSSGSPVFNNQWKPVALHHASVLTEGPEGRALLSGAPGRYLNEGIRLSAIALWLETAEAIAPARRAQLARLRSLFGGLDPRGGFFGGLGHSVAGVRGCTEVFDVGRWDTRALAAGPGGLRRRTAEVGRVMAEMGLDLWCLSHVDADGLDALCDHLWEAHGLGYLPILSAPAGVGAGALVRQSATIVAEPLALGPGRIPPRLRVGFHPRATAAGGGGVVELFVVPLDSEQGDVFAAETAAAASRDGAAGGPTWLFLGDADPVVAVGSRALDAVNDPDIDSLAVTLVAADAPGHGTALAILGLSSPVVALTASPNLSPTLDPSGLLTIAEACKLPPSLGAINGPAPIAIRLVLTPTFARPAAWPVPPARVDVSPQAPPLPPTPPTSSLDDLIEQRLKDLIGPVVALILDEARRGLREEVRTGRGVD